MTDEPVTVLVLEDEPQVSELYEQLLKDRYEVVSVESASAAREIVDDTIDVALLDRRLPEESGASILGWFREQGYDFPVAMVTAVDPTMEVVEFDLDAYLLKPVDPAKLRTTVERLVRQRGYEPDIRSLVSMAAVRTTLERTADATTLEDSDAYDALGDRLIEAADEAQLDDSSVDITREDRQLVERAMDSVAARRDDGETLEEVPEEDQP